MEEENNKIYQRAIKKWGETAQMLVAVEEFSELSRALVRHVSDRDRNIHNIVEEMADAEIMLEQLKLIFSDDIAFFLYQKREKLNDLAELVE
jgi:hypothetical protein